MMRMDHSSNKGEERGGEPLFNISKLLKKFINHEYLINYNYIQILI